MNYGSVSEVDIIELYVGIAPSNVSFTREGNSLVFTFASSVNDKIFFADSLVLLMQHKLINLNSMRVRFGIYKLILGLTYH